MKVAGHCHMRVHVDRETEIARQISADLAPRITRIIAAHHVPVLLHAEVRSLTLTDVWTAREVFICGTGAEVVPVVTVDGRTIGDGQSGPMTERLIAAYDYLVRSTGTPIFSPWCGSTSSWPAGLLPGTRTAET